MGIYIGIDGMKERRERERETSANLANWPLFQNLLGKSWKIQCKSSIKRLLLGSKILGTKCIRTSMCNVLANHAQSVFKRKVGIKWLQNLLD